jgi:hypothetical protein
MANRLDYRHHPEAIELRKRLPDMRFTPLVGATDLREIVKVFENLPNLVYPINSAGELIEQLGGGEKMLNIAGAEVDLLLIIKRMPAYYFPVASSENFVEKMADLIRANRKQTDVPTQLMWIKRQLPPLDFPIESSEQLLKALGDRQSIVFQGNDVDAREILERIHKPSLFPIESQEDFDRKVAGLMAARELIVKD